MFLKNHIAYRFLTDDTLIIEFMEEQYPQILNENYQENISEVEFSKIQCLFKLLNNENQRAFLVTDTVLSKLDLLKVKKLPIGQYDWSVFKELGNLKYTFILPRIPERKGGGCLRIKIDGDTIEFAHISFQFKEGNKDYGNAYWTLFFVDRKTNKQCEHWSSHNVLMIEEFVYKLLCFVFLSENEEEIIKPGEKKGTRKSGKIINILPIPLTVINSKWNITSIRTEGFDVSGHFRLQPTSTGTKMIFINPFQKHGYVRRAKNETV